MLNCKHISTCLRFKNPKLSLQLNILKSVSKLDKISKSNEIICVEDLNLGVFDLTIGASDS